MKQDDNDLGGWLADQGKADQRIPSGFSAPQGQSAGKNSSFDPQDLTSISGVTRLTQSNTPADLLSRVEAKWYNVEQIYQVDNVSRWRNWKGVLNSTGTPEKWLFFACPLALIEEVVEQCQLLPYGEFFPRLMGENAIYLHHNGEHAAQAAFKFGMESEGYLISCRVAPGNIFKASHGNPRATSAPRGYDSVMATRGTDLGNGPIPGALFAIYSPDQALIRYITHIKRSDGKH